MKVVINGAGIGGLTAALILNARGIECELHEASTQIRELGVGINVLPHAIRELAEIGLLPELDKIGIRTRELIYANRHGQEIWREPRGMHQGHAYPQFSIHRGRMHAMLANAVKERIGTDSIKLGSRGIGFEQDAGSARLLLEGGGAADGDVLLGADGVHSSIRGQMFPDEAGLRWNGIMMWRGATEVDQFADGRTMIIAGGFTYKLVLYPIALAAKPGKVLMNWVVTYRLGGAGDTPPKREDWNRKGTLTELIPHIETFGVDVIDLMALVRATPEFLEYPMCDRDPLPRWSDGRVTLLGDAAHPMYPVGSNGASQAILDARALGDALARSSSPIEALQSYDNLRRPATAAVVALNRLGGPEGVIDEVERRAPAGFENLDNIISREERAAIVGGYASTAGFEAKQTQKRAVNGR